MKFLTIVLFQFLLTQAFCQSVTVKGVLLDDSNKPSFAELEIQMIHMNKIVACSAINHCGEFELSGLKPGTYKFIMLNESRPVFQESILISVGTTNLNLAYQKKSLEVTRICPYKHADQLVTISYGTPSRGQMDRAKLGKVILGGCILGPSTQYCKKHKIEF